MPRDEAPSILEQQLFNLPPTVLESIVQKVVDAKAADSAAVASTPAPVATNSNSMSAFEQAAEARMAAAKKKSAELDVAEKARITAMQQANATASVATPADTAVKPVAETAEERLARIKNARLTGDGTEPPYAAPKGTHWSFIAGEWKLYKDFDVAPDNKNGGGGKKEVSRVDNGDGTWTVTYDDKSVEVIGTKDTDSVEKPVGTPPAYVYNPVTKTWEQPPKPTTAGTWAWDNTQGWVDSTIQPGSTGNQFGSERILAKDTFKNTLALFFGVKEMSQSWVDDIYKVVSGYYKTGSSPEEALNMAVQEVRTNPALASFTKRFKGIYALQDRLVQGEAVTVPTVAEYFKTEADMGDILREAGMGDIATQDFLGDVLGKGKSVLEVSNLISKTFASIDNAPEALKKTLGTYFPMLSRVDLAKGLLLGKEGAAELNKKVSAISVLSAGQTQGVNMDLASAGDIAALGYNYLESLSGFGSVRELDRANTLASFEGNTYTQNEAVSNVFNKDFAAQEKARLLKEKESARFSGRSGLMSSSLRGKSTNTVI